MCTDERFTQGFFSFPGGEGRGGVVKKNLENGMKDQRMRALLRSVFPCRHAYNDDENHGSMSATHCDHIHMGCTYVPSPAAITSVCSIFIQLTF